MPAGGKRPNSGRKKGKRGALQQTAIDIASAVLASVDAHAIWCKLLTCDDQKIVLSTIQYLTNRIHGMPAQQIVGDPTRPIAIKIEWSGGPPEWLPK